MVTLDEAGCDAPPLQPVARDLARWVEHAWIQHTVKRHTPRRVVPDASGHVLVKRLAGGTISAFVVGPRTRYCDVDAEREFTIGMRLRPGVIPLLTGLPATSLTDRALPLRDVIADSEPVLELAAAGHAEACLRALQQHVRRKLEGNAIKATIAAIDTAPTAGVRRTAAAVGLSERRLRQVVLDEVGLTPVRWARVRRLHRALSIAVGAPEVSIGRVAAAAGYFDQPHMSRDFHELLGETPSAFIGRASAESY